MKGTELEQDESIAKLKKLANSVKPDESVLFVHHCEEGESSLLMHNMSQATLSNIIDHLLSHLPTELAMILCLSFTANEAEKANNMPEPCCEHTTRH